MNNESASAIYFIILNAFFDKENGNRFYWILTNQMGQPFKKKGLS